MFLPSEMRDNGTCLDRCDLGILASAGDSGSLPDSPGRYAMKLRLRLQE